jgi:hypothetical protein
MRVMFDLKAIQAQWVLRMLPVDELTGLATLALTHGFESRSLVQLAGLQQNEMTEASRLFGCALSELNCGRMDETEALQNYTRHVASLILASEVTPLIGAKRIWRAKLNVNGVKSHEWDSFIYAASELEERPLEKKIFEVAIIEEARRWVGQAEAQGQGEAEGEKQK